MTLQQTVEQTVTGLGYDLVEVARLNAGLLRVTIDMPWQPGQEDTDAADARAITLDDCEAVSRQLQFALEVAGEDYRRLEVSSPGLDRPLRHARDFARFSGQVVDIVLREALTPAQVSGGVPDADGRGLAGRKKFRGHLEPDGDGWQLVLLPQPAARPGQRVGKKRAARLAEAPPQVLRFALEDVREARLAVLPDFRRRTD